MPNFCNIIGYLEAVCRKKRQQQDNQTLVRRDTKSELVRAILGEDVSEDVPKLEVPASHFVANSQSCSNRNWDV